MKNFLYGSLLLLGVTTLTACDNNHDDLWDAIDKVNSRIDDLESLAQKINGEVSTLSGLVTALQNHLSITSIQTTSDGYQILFSDGSIVTIHHGTNGKDGKDGQGVPEISIRQDIDGNYYWTLGNDWLIVDGHKVRANGIDGVNGTDGMDGMPGAPGIAPQVRINPETNEWEISIDNGEIWNSTGIKATGDSGSDGDSMFSSVTIGSEWVIFTLTNGTQFSLPIATESNQIKIIDSNGNDPTESLQELEGGVVTKYKISSGTIIDSNVYGPQGWTVKLNGSELSVIPPKIFCETDDKIGNVTIILTTIKSRSYEEAKTTVITFEVIGYEMRYLTFEDGTEKFSSYKLDRGSVTFDISNWSDLIDEIQYGGQLLYGDSEGIYGSGSADQPYWWYDEGNTFLRHEFPENYGSYIYWGGGHAISNYTCQDPDVGNDDLYQIQLSVFADENRGGHNSSKNFAVHYGYMDGSGFNLTEELPSLTFGDGEERIIDHLWVKPTVYALLCYADGNFLTSYLGPDDYVYVEAIGYNSKEQETGKTRFYLASGEDNIITSWAKFDLSVLGKVSKVKFNVLGSNDNGYGFSQPAYFAYDDVAVRFY